MHIAVLFSGHSKTRDCEPDQLSRTEPRPLAGSYSSGVGVFYVGFLRVYDDGDRVEYKQQGVVVGPALDEAIETHIAVRFDGHAHPGTCDCRPDELSRTVPRGSRIAKLRASSVRVEQFAHDQNGRLIDPLRCKGRVREELIKQQKQAQRPERSEPTRDGATSVEQLTTMFKNLDQAQVHARQLRGQGRVDQAERIDAYVDKKNSEIQESGKRTARR